MLKLAKNATIWSKSADSESIESGLASFSQSFQLFFVGVSRFAESNLGPPPLEGYISSDSVLHRLAVELYSIVYPALSSWEGIRGRMAANEAEWSLPLSEELPEGLSDESPGRVTREDSSEAAPSTSGARQSSRVDRSWKALSYYSRVTQDDIDRMRRRYQIPDDVVLRIPDSDERACCPKYGGDVAFYEADLKAGLRFPIQPFVRELLDFLGLAPGQVNPNGWRTIIACMVMWRNRDANTRIVQGLPSSDRIWKDKYFFVCGDNWERLPQEDPRDFVGVRSVGSSFTELRLAAEDFKDTWILKIVGVNTMKLNKSRLRQLAQSGEVAVEPLVLKRKRAGEGSSKQAEEPPTRPPLTQAAPLVQDPSPVIMVDLDLNPPSDPSAATISRSPHVAMDRAKVAVTTKDMDDYAAAHTEDVRILMVHSLMRVCF
uniref:Transposase (putative) gypsy type domain-containing protein n=1 Tax=Fagus sylvatica TaxID=28930 RepID=A0A2N9IZD3_FAGSY